MPRRSPDPVAILRSTIPDAFFVDFIRAVALTHRETEARCIGMGPYQLGVKGHVRRALLSNRLTPIAERHGGAADCEFVWNNSSCHIEVEFGEMLFTLLPASTPFQFPDEADYRTSLAAAQSELFAQFERRPRQGARLYGVLGYSTTCDDETALPYFAYVGFPDPSMRFYAHTVNLSAAIEALEGVTQFESEPASSDAPPVFEEENTDEVPPMSYRLPTANTDTDESDE